MLTSYQGKEWVIIRDNRRHIEVGRDRWCLSGDIDAFIELKDAETFRAGKGVTGPLCPIFGWCNSREMTYRIAHCLMIKRDRSGDGDFNIHNWHPVYYNLQLYAVVKSSLIANNPLLRCEPLPIISETILPSVSIPTYNTIMDCLEL